MIVSTKLENLNGTAFNGEVTVKNALTGAAVRFKPQSGGQFSTDAISIVDGNLSIEIESEANCIVSSSDGALGLSVFDGEVISTNAAGSLSGAVTVAAEYEGTVDLERLGDYLTISGELTALASAGASCCTLMHWPATPRSVLVAVDGTLATATLGTEGGVVLGSAPAEGTVIEFLGSTIK